ncbi:MAG TPA: helix-turn-helix domain-containing protein [Streptosporangiaceae bacterium]|jgi:AcrR family transcriptional regulator
MSGQRSDTREKIQQLALELFSEQGYDQTSLREIAERLGVTKAALYYHFKSKEDIVASLFQDVNDEVDNVIKWAEGQPSTPATRQELIRRYAAMTRGRGSALFRFLQENRAAVHELKTADEMRERYLRLAQLVSDPEAPLTDQFRARLAFFALNGGAFVLRDYDITSEERDDIALQVALELVAGSG